MLDYAALSALAAVVREGSFERAAQSLYVTPSAVSQRIRSLEEKMGSALVVRGQPCRATDTGRRLCQHVDRVRLLEQELQGAAGEGGRVGVFVDRLPPLHTDGLCRWHRSRFRLVWVHAAGRRSHIRCRRLVRIAV